jgi:large subunit ribosomal protein L22
LRKLIESAKANAEEKDDALDGSDLFISEIYVNEGPTLKRFRPRAMGRATRINKRTSHVTCVLAKR